MRDHDRSLVPYAIAVAAAIAVAVCGSALSAQQDFSAVQIQSQKVSGNVHMLIGAGGNIGVSAGEDGILIVDDQFAPLADKIRASLAAIKPGPVVFLLNTHFHGDHTGGNAAFGGEATIVAHQNVRKRLANEQTVRGQTVAPSPKVALPVVTFENSLSIHWNGEEIRVTYLPIGHTDGDSIVHFTGSNVVHMGDDFFAGRFPYVDLGSGGNAVSLAANVGKVIATLPADVKIIPGHGPLSTLDDLKHYHRMLEDTIATVKKAKDSGRSLDQVKEAGFAAEWKDWGGGFINAGAWAEIVYNSLK